MPALSLIDVYPSTGHPDRLWGAPPEDPVLDAFLRSARCVCELYGRALAQVHQPALKSMFRITPSTVAMHQDDDLEVVQVMVWTDRPGEFPGEMGWIHLPSSVGALDELGRSMLVLNCVDAAVRELGRVRGFTVEAMDMCRRHVEEADFVYGWASPWKSSPNRHLQARATFRLSSQDGFGRVQLEVREKDTGEVVASGPEALAFCTSKGFRRSAATLRWHGAGEVSMTPYGGWPASGVVAAINESDGWRVRVRDDVKVRQPAPGSPNSAELPEVVITPLVVPQGP